MYIVIYIHHTYIHTSFSPLWHSHSSAQALFGGRDSRLNTKVPQTTATTNAQLRH